MKYSHTHGNTKLVVNVKMNNTNHKYFSVTADEYESSAWRAGGCMHERIRQVFGDMFDDVIPMHLSNEDGVPMHALENGYWYLQHPEEYDTFVVSNHFRIPLDRVESLRKKSKKQLAYWIKRQLPRWKREATKIRSKYGI